MYLQRTLLVPAFWCRYTTGATGGWSQRVRPVGAEGLCSLFLGFGVVKVVCDVIFALKSVGCVVLVWAHQVAEDDQACSIPRAKLHDGWASRCIHALRRVTCKGVLPPNCDATVVAVFASVRRGPMLRCLLHEICSAALCSEGTERYCCCGRMIPASFPL